MPIFNFPVRLSKKSTSQVVIYLLAFLFTLHLTPTIYINSTFLEQFVSEGSVGYIFTIASILTLISLVLVKRVLRLVGNYKVFLGAVIIDLLSLLTISLSLFFNNGFWGNIYIIAYIIGHVIRVIAFLNLDIFLEHVSSNKDTGGIRGVYLTALNSAYIIGTLIAGLLINDVLDVGKAYLLQAIILIPVIVIAFRYFRGFEDDRYEKSDIWKTFKQVSKNRDLSKIFSANFILRFFYAWMVIYAPIFLHNIGYSLGQIALLMGFVLLPFILLEAPLGKIADKKLGEKEILSLGFIITGFTTMSLSFLNFSAIWMWALILFVTRVGASMIEIMTETYLFKKIDSEDLDVMSLYRAIGPIAWIVAPLIASLFLIFVDIKFLFLILGIISLYGLKFSLTIKDTR